MKSKSQLILMAGGGTGGHIYPAVAAARALQALDPALRIEFVGTHQGLETKIVPKEGYAIHFISSGKLNQVGFFERLVSLVMIPFGIAQAVLLLLRLRPALVLGIGGFASGPVMIAGILLRRKMAIFECNAFPGLTNRWIGRFVQMAFVNFEDTRKFFARSKAVGLPLRADIVNAMGPNAGDREEKRAPATIGSRSKIRILVFGGSQGARGINTAVVEAVRRGGDWLSRVEIVHQIGATDFKKVNAEYQELKSQHGAGFVVQWFEFLYDMPQRYRWADVVVCRAGASTVAEVAMVGMPAVFVPLPTAADDHQKKNAELLANVGAAIMIEQKNLTPELLIETLMKLQADSGRLKQLALKVQKFAQPKSAEILAREIQKLIHG